MRDDPTPRSDNPPEAVDLPLPGIETARGIQGAQEHLLVAGAALEGNELHAGGQTCTRCGRPIRPDEDVRRTAQGSYQHELCQPRRE
jgi:hypothetical protein